MGHYLPWLAALVIGAARFAVDCFDALVRRAARTAVLARAAVAAAPSSSGAPNSEGIADLDLESFLRILLAPGREK